MQSAFTKMLCRFLIAALVFLPFQTVYAGMITTEKAVSSAAAQADRAAVLSVLSRSEVAKGLQDQGLDPKLAAARVNAMTDQEVHTLASQIDTAPAGAKSTNGWVWAAVIILIAVVIYYNWK
jgi:hypothetical protein